ncbi:SGNH/GDSL hydrolase family protein [Microterricola pindariensis]|uniref:SGNH/GDSL hydrolase family protein n=1 Tax=Microterricola pindariensis TaxID=478010 RepID=UPI00105738A8|nr:SGNH/GDSL hydrolase family protein [Microterricola pindariensis]
MLGPLFWGWFKAKTQEQHEWRYPTGPSEIKIAGTDPARILIIGDGPAAGFGVRTHQLGIAGHLARHLSRHIEGGVVVTVAAQPAASARSTRKCLSDIDVEGYDSIVLMLATTDAFCLTSRRSWRRNMTGLVHALKSTDASSVFVTSAASLHLARPLTPFARRLTGRHARTLNVETTRICAQTNTPMIWLDAASDLTSRTYAKWGRRIGTRVAGSMRVDHDRRVQISRSTHSYRGV